MAEELTYQDFWQETLGNIESTAAAEGVIAKDVFFEKFKEQLIESNVFGDLEKHFFETRNPNPRYKIMRIDYGLVDVVDGSINLLAIDYDQTQITSITNEIRNRYFDQMLAFVDNVQKRFFIERGLQSDSIFPFTLEIRDALNTCDNINLFLLSTNRKSSQLHDYSIKTFVHDGRGINVNAEVIDIEYLFKTTLSDKHCNPVDIKVNEMGTGITGLKALDAGIENAKYKAYLAVLPGDFLSEVYRRFGGRLLENNVRSFLSTRGNINKGIRNTIRTCPDKFFTYNNGIACTAASIKTEQRSDGLYITGMNDFQIINGGQTTASLRNAVLTDKDHVVDLTKVAIAMKLTVMNEQLDPDEKESMVHDISKYSNSQNKVQNSDLNSNSPVYIRLEKISRATYTPIASNPTMWYFERSRGQYERDQMELTKAKREAFKKVHPLNQRIRIVDIAKFYNSVDLKPYHVVWGGQVNAERFQSTIEDLWSKNPDQFNEWFFKKLCAQGILFQKTREIIAHTEKYQEHTGILALVAPYVIATFVERAQRLKKSLDWRYIWNKQALPVSYEKEIERLSNWVIDVILDPNREKDNVGEWTKLQKCWTGMCGREYSLENDTIQDLVDNDQIKAQQTAAKKEERANQEVDNGLAVFNLGAQYWSSFKAAGQKYNKFTLGTDLEAIDSAIKGCMKGRLVPAWISKRLMQLKREFEEEGIPVESVSSF